MVQCRSYLNVVDNSKIKNVQCLSHVGKSPAIVGSVLLVSIKKRFCQEINIRNKFFKGSLVRGVLVHSRSKHRRLDGSFFVFQRNAVIVVDSQGRPVGRRIRGVAPRELRRYRFLKIVSLASWVF